jgi:hypothetical protein
MERRKEKKGYRYGSSLIRSTPILQYSITPVLRKCGGETDGKKNREQREEEKSRKGAIA